MGDFGATPSVRRTGAEGPDPNRYPSRGITITGRPVRPLTLIVNWSALLKNVAGICPSLQPFALSLVPISRWRIQPNPQLACISQRKREHRNDRRVRQFFI